MSATTVTTQFAAPDRRVAFVLNAMAEPGVLPRVLELFAKRGLVPAAFHGDHDAVGDTLAISVEVVGMAPVESDHVGRCLGQIPGVTAVHARELPCGEPALAAAE